MVSSEGSSASARDCGVCWAKSGVAARASAIESRRIFIRHLYQSATKKHTRISTVVIVLVLLLVIDRESMPIEHEHEHDRATERRST